jgi:hypothetical protein
MSKKDCSFCDGKKCIKLCKEEKKGKKKSGKKSDKKKKGN